MKTLNLFYRGNELVVSATHYPKPISQVAENIAVVTADEIKAMNAHSVLEVLNRIPGIFLGGYDRNFGTTANLQIQGGESQQTLVLLDGVRWNFLDEGNAFTSDIPVGIIDRIEIIKGPASSAWGSSLGGVVNIITKSGASAEAPATGFYASYGERRTSDLRVDHFGSAGNTEYYLFAGRMDSDGLRVQRGMESNYFYSNIRIPVQDRIKLGLSAGYSTPELSYDNLSALDLSFLADVDTFFSTVNLDAELSDEMRFNVESHFYKNDFLREDRVLTGAYWDLNQPGDVLQAFNAESAKYGGSGKMVWKKGYHTVLLGFELEHGKTENRAYFSPGYGYTGYAINPKVDTNAAYFNDTMAFGLWSVTPGVRYDHNSISGDFVSPSLGITYRVSNQLLFRGMISQGFTSPPLAYTSGGGLFLVPNPDLKPETITSWQGGVESGITDKIWVKFTFFRHEVEDVFYKKWDAVGPYMDMWINDGESARNGFEFEMHTVPFEYISFHYGATYVHHSPEDQYGATDQISLNIKLAYDNPDIINLQLMGHHLWWDEDPGYMGVWDDFIWDLNVSKPISITKTRKTEVFVMARNLFNGVSYDDYNYQNPKRWVEAGINVSF